MKVLFFVITKKEKRRMRKKILNKFIKVFAVLTVAFTSLAQFQPSEVKALAYITVDCIL